MTANEPANPVERLRELRETSTATKAAAAAYAAAHGHLPGTGDPRHDVGRARWALYPRTAIVATAALLVLSCLGTYLLTKHSGEVTVFGLAGDGMSSTGLDANLSVTTVDEATSSERFAVSGDLEPQSTSMAFNAPTLSVTTGDQAAPEAELVMVVDVVGQVKTPGLVRLAAGARVGDAVAAAGGATVDADVSAINMARIVTDGEQIRVPAPGEEVQPPPPAPVAAVAPSGTLGIAGSEAAPALVNVNTADAATLETLPGIGPVLAKRILDWRAENGWFASKDELIEVSGIGPALFAKIRDLVTT